MKKAIWNCAFCILVCLAISSEADLQLNSYVSQYARRPYYMPLLSLNFKPSLPSNKPINTCDSCECGVTKRNRIVGGENTSHREFPWLIKLDYKGRPHCGGTVISPRHIITAAHCTAGRLPHTLTIKFVDGTVRRGKTINQHYRYSDKTFENDIAIIEMDSNVDFDEGLVKRVCLPTEGQDFSGSLGVAAGWGHLYEGLRGNKELNKVILPIMSKAECDKSGYGKYRISSDVFCAGYMEGGKDTCQGDSGGPLTVRQNERMVLAGIVSNGKGCARTGLPGIYTKVSNYMSWINEHTRGQCICVNKD